MQLEKTECVALRILAAVSFIFYNKDLFRRAGLDSEKPPANFEEIYQAAKAIAKLTGPEESETMIVATNGHVTMNAIFHERMNFKTGDPIHLSPKPGTCHYFSADNGIRIE